MPILYLLTAPEPEIAGTDAVHQEAETLCTAFGGTIENLYPLRRPVPRFPRRLYGLHKLPSIRKLANKHDLIHVYCHTLCHFPLLQFLNKPVVFTVAAGLTRQNKPANLENIAQFHSIIVSNSRDAKILSEWGLHNHHIVEPGVEGPEHRFPELALDQPMTLLMASAPWVSSQFDQKGVDVLLDVAVARSSMKLVLLWRGVLVDELKSKLHERGITSQVTVVNHEADIYKYLQQAHATVLLAKNSPIVKAFPHSLVESLLAGKPILISNQIPMADFVNSHRCGLVLDEVSAEQLHNAIDQLTDNYGAYVQNTSALPVGMFSKETLIEKHRNLYASLLS